MPSSPWPQARCRASEFTAFLEETLGNAARVSRDGAVHFVCMDWRHVGELIEAGREVYGEMLNLVVWDKVERRPRQLLSQPA